MNRNQLRYVPLYAGIIAGPFVKSYFERHGVSTAFAWVGGLAVLGIGGLVSRLMRGAPSAS